MTLFPAPQVPEHPSEQSYATEEMQEISIVRDVDAVMEGLSRLNGLLDALEKRFNACLAPLAEDNAELNSKCGPEQSVPISTLRGSLKMSIGELAASQTRIANIIDRCEL